MKKVIYAFLFIVALSHSAASIAQTHYQSLKAQAAQGDSRAQYSLGLFYEGGMGVPQDYQEAVRWYGFAAEQQHSRAQFNLGVMYANGRGVPQDFSEALKWYRLAAGQGLLDAQYNLGRMYAWGIGTTPDYERAFVWFSIVADREPQTFGRGMVAEAVTTLGILMQQLTPQALLEAQNLANRCVHSNFRDCGE